MECYVFDDVIASSEASYLVKTANSEAQKKIVSSLFRGGDLIISRSEIYNGNLTEDQLLEKVRECHTHSKTGIQCLFDFSNKYRNSRDIGKHVLLIRALTRNKLYDEALTEIETLLRTSPNLSTLHFYSGKIHLERNQYGKAVNSLSQAIKLKSNYADYHFFLGQVYFKIEQYRNAIHEFSHAVELNPYYHDACFYLGMAFLKNAVCKEDFELARNVISKARTQFVRACQIYPNLKNADYHAGMNHLQKGELEEALDRFVGVPSAQRSPIDAGFVLDFHVRYLSNEDDVSVKEIERHIDRLRELIRRYGNYADLHHELGIAYLILSKSMTKKAMASFRDAVSLNPSYTTAQRRLKRLESNKTRKI